MKEPNSIRRARQRATTVSRERGITHQQALDVVARDAGRSNWSAFLSDPPNGRSAVVHADAQIGPGPGDHPLSAFWLRISRTCGVSAFDHIACVASVFGDGANATNNGRLLFSAVAVILDDPTPASVGEWLADAVVTTAAEAERRNAEAAASKQLPTCSSSAIMAQRLAEASGDREVAIVASRLATMATREADATVSEARAIAARMSEWPNIRPSWRIPHLSPGVIALAIGRSLPLGDDERAILLKALAEGADRVADVSHASTNLRAACEAISDATSFADAPLVALIGSSQWPFVKAESSDFRSALIAEDVLLDMEASDSSGVFSTWMRDAVAKVGRGARPFRFNPLALNDAGNAYGTSWVETQRRVAGSLLLAADGAGKLPPHVREAGADALLAMTRVCLVGIEKKSISEVAAGVGSEPSIPALSAMMASVEANGVEDLILYARICGHQAETISALRGLADSDVRAAITTALAPFSHPLMSRACAA